MQKKPETALECLEQLADAFKDLGKEIFIVFEPIIKDIVNFIKKYILRIPSI